VCGAGDGTRTRDIQLGKNNDDMPSINFAISTVFLIFKKVHKMVHKT